MAFVLGASVCQFLATLACWRSTPVIDDSPNQKLKYFKLVQLEKSRITDALNKVESDLQSPVHDILAKLEKSEYTHHYSLACLSSAADLLTEEDWSLSLAIQLVDRASKEDTPQQHVLDLVYTDNEEYASKLFGSRKVAWNFFCKLVSVLEWTAHPIETRQEVMDTYIRLLSSQEADVFELREAIHVYTNVVKWLLPRKKPFGHEGVGRAVERARELVFSL